MDLLHYWQPTLGTPGGLVMIVATGQDGPGCDVVDAIEGILSGLKKPMARGGEIELPAQSDQLGGGRCGGDFDQCMPEWHRSCRGHEYTRVCTSPEWRGQ